MEAISIIVLSVVRNFDRYRARARATAQDAVTMLEVTFAVHPEASKSEISDRARDEVVRYLDPL